jgi:3-oxoacyl-(acyl-carrier-protein) synthase
MMTSILGIGWLTKKGYGRIRTGIMHSYEPGKGPDVLLKKDMFSHPFKNFGRLDAISKMTAYAVSLALQDAGIAYLATQKRDIGIIGTNVAGSLRSDVEYFTDYVRSGRTLSRGNLFIYTLPSSPLGESAIHFGFLGPLLYAAGPDASLITVLDTAEEMLLAKETQIMLAGRAEEDEALFFVMGQGSAGNSVSVCDLMECRSILGSAPDIAGMVQKFSEMGLRKA